MSLEKKLQGKYSKGNYEQTFSKDFREAIRSVDVITRSVIKATHIKRKKRRCN